MKTGVHALKNEKNSLPRCYFISDISLKDEILEKGQKVKADIISCEIKKNPKDDEHEIFSIDYEYTINLNKIKKQFNFSINTAHIHYAFKGKLGKVPKTNCSLDEFKQLLSAGNKLEIISLPNPPYDYILYFDDRINEITKYDEIWM